MKLNKRILSTCLIISIAVTGCIGTNAEAMQKDNDKTIHDTNDLKNLDFADTGNIVRKKEKKSERTQYSTTYKLSNGAYETELYNTEIRYKDEKSGRLVDYDASLVEIKDNDKIKGINNLQEYKYQNKSGDRKNYFPAKLKDSTPIITEFDDYKISIVPTKSHTSKVSLDKSAPVQSVGYYAEQKDSYSVTYSNIKEDTDINIVSLENGIKENIILKEKPDSNIFEYQINVKGCYPKLDVIENDNDYASTVSFYNKNTDEKIACIQEAFMTDSSLDGAYNNDCSYMLKKAGKNKYILSLVVSKEYLEDQSRVYPVTIDPTVVWTSASYINDTYVAAGRQCMANYSSSSNLVVGRYQNEYNYSYISFPYLYSYCKNRSVYSVRLYLTETAESDAGKKIQLFKVNGTWNANTLTYDSRPAVESNAYASITTSGRDGTGTGISLDSYVRELCSGTDNFARKGFMLAQSDNNTDIKSSAIFYSQRAVNTNYRPKLVIMYYDNPTKADSFIVSPYNKNTGRNIAVAYSGIESQILSHVQYKVEKYDDKTKQVKGSYIPYSSNTIIGTSSNGSSVIDTSMWPEGCYKISIRGVDTYSTYGPESSQILHIDLTKPKAYNSCFSFSDSANSVRNYSSEPPVIKWQGIEEEHVESVEMKINNEHFYEIGNTASGSYAVPVTQVLQGCNTIQYRIRDLAGNVSDIVTNYFYYDSELPVINAALSRETSENNYCNASDVTFTYNVNDSSTYMIQYSINGGDYSTCCYYAAEGNIELPDYFYNGGEGKKTVKVRAVDLAGNISNEVELNYYYDCTPPDVVASVFPPANPHSYMTEIPTINYNVSDYSYKQLEVQLGNTNHKVGTVQKEGSIKLPPSWFDDTGEYELIVTARDMAGNTTTARLYYYYNKSNISANDYIPENITINERMDGSAEIIWNRLYDNALPSDISYSVYAGNTSDFVPCSSNLIQEGIKQNRAVIPKRSAGHYYYKICARKTMPTGAEYGISEYVTVETNAVSAEELTKRLGTDDKYGYVNFLIPCGTGKIERSNGNYNYTQTDYSIPCGKLSFDLTREYNSQSNKRGVLGTGWTTWYEMQAYESDNDIMLEDGDGSYLVYVNNGDGKYYSEKDEESYFVKNTDSDAVGYRQIYKDGTVYTYNNYGHLIKIQEVNGSYLEIKYDYHNRVVERIISHSKNEEADGQSVYEVRFIYSFSNYNNGMRLIGIMLPNKAILEYSHYEDKLTEVKLKGENGVGEISYKYEYQNGKLVKIYDAKKTGIYNIQYDNNRVLKCIYPDGTYIQMDYRDSTSESAYSTKTAQGKEISGGYEVYNENGYVIRMTDWSGASSGTLHSYQYDGHKMTGSMENIEYQKLVNGIVSNYQKSIGDTFEYERNGNVTRVEYSDGSIVTYEYGLNGDVTKNLPTSITKEDGTDTFLKYNLEYNQKGNVTKIEDTINNITLQVIYDADGNAIKETNTRKQENESIINTEYDDAGNPVKENVKAGTVDTTTRYSYDDMGRVLTEINGEDNKVIIYEYDSFGRKIKAVERAGGKLRVAQYEYDDNGSLIKEITPYGAVNTYVYDTMNRVVQQNVTADGETTSTYTTYEYTDVDILTGKTGSAFKKTIKNVLCSTEKDKNGLILSQSYTDGTGHTVRSVSQGICTDYLYDSRGNVTSEYIHGKSETDGILNAYVYDKDGYCTAKLNGARWNSSGQIIKDDKTIVTTKVYDALGNVISETDAEGNMTGYGYTEDKKLSKIALPGASDISRRYTYNEKNPDGSFADRTYDSNDHMSEVVSNAAGQILYTADYGDGNEKIKTTYEYDNTGNVIRQDNGNGSFIIFSYDEKGQCIRKQGVSYSEIKQTDTFYEYDEHGNVICMKDYIVDDSTNQYTMKPLCNTYYQYNEKGLLTASGQIMYDAEPTDSKIQESLTHYSYDIHDNLIKIKHPEGTGDISEEYIEYNDNLQISAVKAVMQGETTKRTLRTYAYDGRGNISSICENTEFASDSGEHLITKSYSYDDFDRISSIKYSDDTGIFEEYNYEYDKNSNITKETLKRGENIEIRSHVYTARGQLSDTYINYNGKSIEPYHYTYDEEGNRTSLKNGYTTSYQYNGLNQMTKQTVQLYSGIVTNYVYDGSGNQTEENAVTEGNKKLYRYDPHNRLVSVKKKQGDADYVTLQENNYNGEDARVCSSTDGVTTDYYYQQGKLSYTVNEEDNSSAKYLYGGNSGVILREENSASQTDKNYCFYTKDIKGSTMSLLSEAGETQVTYKYDDYGKTTSTTAASNTSKAGTCNQICYTGGVYDKNTELYYLNARYYNPDEGIFLTQDSYRGTKEDAATWNLYAYCCNNPVNYADPSGHAAVPYEMGEGLIKILEYFGIAVSFEMMGEAISENWNNIKDSVQDGFDNIVIFLTKDTGVVTAPAKPVAPEMPQEQAQSASKPQPGPQPPSKSPKKSNKRNKDNLINKQKKGTPRNNKSQNEMVDAVVKKLKLTKKERRLLHNEIKKMGYSFKEILEEGKEILRMRKVK